MTYVDAHYDKNKDIVRVVERVNGKRVINDVRPNYDFYIEDAQGSSRTIYGGKASLMKCKSRKELFKNVRMHGDKKLYDSDLNTINRVLSEHYDKSELPDLHTAFIDIETDFDPEKGFSSPENPFAMITAIGVYNQWMDTMICISVPPPTLAWEQALDVTKDMPNVHLCKTEAEMISIFLDVIDDADILSGWNSEGYDIPYLVNRTRMVLGKAELRRYCLFNQIPKERIYDSHGKDAQTFDLIGRVHLDYMALYRQYNYEERHSYRLDFIGEVEVNETKLHYDGTLDALYKHDYKKFLEYNIQDVMLLHKLDLKLGFIALACDITHDSTVLLPKAMGAVAVTDQAIVNEAHRLGLVLPKRSKRKNDGTQVPGGYVADPQAGFWPWVGSMDLNSLYPSVIRALNMSPETLVAQVLPVYTDEEITAKMQLKNVKFSDAWNGKFASNEYELVMAKDTSKQLILKMEDSGEEIECTGGEIYNLLFHGSQKWVISANGTIFRTDVMGIVPGLLKRWYEERQELQAKKKNATTPEERKFWDKRQLVKKINLNSLYGALLNSGCRFFDQRIGQSTTLTGRSITRHMAAETHRQFTGDYNYTGDTIVYGDTDSVYFSATKYLPADANLSLDDYVDLFDHVSDTVSDTFPSYLKAANNIDPAVGSVMKAGREVVGQSGLFITKKRYAICVADMEGKRPDTPTGLELKIMGMDIKRSDTPEFIQDFLQDALFDALSLVPEQDVMNKIKTFKQDFKSLDPWKKGMPKRVNNLTPYTKKYEQVRRVNNKTTDVAKLGQTFEGNKMIPGHVSASIHWNYLREVFHDQYSLRVVDGMKVIVCRLKPNPMGFLTIAYPTDEMHLPDWFLNLPFDEDMMEASVLDKKITNVLGKMGWNLNKMNESKSFGNYFKAK